MLGIHFFQLLVYRFSQTGSAVAGFDLFSVPAGFPPQRKLFVRGILYKYYNTSGDQNLEL